MGDTQIIQILHAATLAPSMHNTQPWRFHVEQCTETIKLFADPERMLPRSDPHGRAVHIACGAALFNLRVAAAVAGRQAMVRLLPEPAEPLLLATVRLGGPHRPDEADRELSAAIPARRTNRGPYSNRPVPPGVLAELTEAAQFEGAALSLPGHDETNRLLRLIADAECDLIGDPGYRDELARWVGGERDKDGIPGGATGPRDSERPHAGARLPARPHGRLRLVRGPASARRAVHRRQHPDGLAARRAGPAAGAADRHAARHRDKPAYPAAGDW